MTLSSRIASDHIPLSERMTLCEDGSVTINGNRARISGYGCKFAKITDLTSGLSCEFAWPTVAYVVANKKGRFSS